MDAVVFAWMLTREGPLILNGDLNIEGCDLWGKHPLSLITVV